MKTLTQTQMEEIEGGGLFSCLLSGAALVGSCVDLTVGFCTILAPLGWVAIGTGVVGYAASIDGMVKNC
jgi:hypothetical protein